jgi:hypothetical protein
MAHGDGVGTAGVVAAEAVGSVVGKLVEEGAVLDGSDGDGPAPVAVLAGGGTGVAGGEVSWAQADRNSVATIAALNRPGP